jgi:hypothetical protein
MPHPVPPRPTPSGTGSLTPSVSPSLPEGDGDGVSSPPDTVARTPDRDGVRDCLHCGSRMIERGRCLDCGRAS